MFDEFEDDLIDEPEEGAVPPSGLTPPRENPDCLGHQPVEQQFLTLIDEGRLPHAMIFAGPQGIGKATMAFRLTRYLLAQPVKDDGPGLFGDALPAAAPETLHVAADNPVFRQVASGGHPDLLTIERPFDEKKGKRQDVVPVEQVRRVTPFLRMTASKGGWRIVIIDDADTMNASSQNAVLKILEEPPTNTVLILVAHRAGMFLPTIRSRCRTINFAPLSRDDFATLIRREDPALPDGDIDALYTMSGGSVGQGVRMLHEGGLEAVGRLLGLLQTWPSWDWVQIHALADNLGRRGQEDSLNAFRDIFFWMVQAAVKAKATGETLPAVLNNPALTRMLDHYSLAGWIEICDKLRDGFAQGDYANLDKRQVILNAFMQFDVKKAA